MKRNHDIVTLRFEMREDREASIAIFNAEYDEFDENKEMWEFLPKSQIEYEMVTDKVVEVQMPEWLAHEKGLI